jgi:hypothetical protein
MDDGFDRAPLQRAPDATTHPTAPPPSPSGVPIVSPLPAPSLAKAPEARAPRPGAGTTSETFAVPAPASASKESSGPKTTLKIKLPKTLYKAVKKRAGQLDVSVSQLISRLVREGLDRES